MPVRSGVLPLAFTTPNAYYNNRTRIIALAGPRGVLLANYTMPHIAPDPEKHRFLAYYPDDYKPFTDSAVPAHSLSDVTAFCVPIEVSNDKRITVESGVADMSMAVDSQPSVRDFNIVTFGSTLLDANGASFREHSLHLHMDGAGVQMAGGSTRVRGELTEDTTKSLGITRESPLWSVVPKTAVTFYAADILPDVKNIKALGNMILMLREAISMVASLVNVATTIFGKR